MSAKLDENKTQKMNRKCGNIAAYVRVEEPEYKLRNSPDLASANFAFLERTNRFARTRSNLIAILDDKEYCF